MFADCAEARRIDDHLVILHFTIIITTEPDTPLNDVDYVGSFTFAINN